MKSLESVFANYAATKAALNGRANYEGKPDQVSLQNELPEFFEAILKQLTRLDEFKVEGSFGNGNIANVPWVAVFNKQVTESAQDGYYIVLLFSEHMQSCYLSLNQGFTTFKNQYSAKLARQKIKETADRALNYFAPHPDAILGEIDLAATADLGKGYELGAIESFRYDRATPPDEIVVTEHLKILLGHYDTLVTVAGETLQSLAPVSEAQFQQTVLDKAQPKGKADKSRMAEPPGGIPIPPKQSGKGNGSYARNPNIAAAALANTEFKCELDANHATFISSAKNLPYVEAHHLVPMSQQPLYPFSLDVTANIVALCPMCHKLLHHAQPKNKRGHLLKLLRLRQDKLQEKGISVSAETLLGYYNKDLLEDEA